MNTLNFILLQATPPITTGEMFMKASVPLIDVAVKRGLTLIPLMLFLHLVISLTKMYFGNMRFDPSSMIKVIFIWICLAAYYPLVSSISEAIGYLCSMFGEPGKDILKTLNNLSENAYLKKHTTNFSYLNTKVPFDDATSFFTWLVLAVENGLAMVVRLFIERVRAYLTGFVMVCGPIAFTIATIPGFGGTIGHWTRIFFSVSLWSLTLAILDAIMVNFMAGFTVASGSTLTEAAAVLDLLVVNGVVILMYLSVPVLTSFYLGASAAGSFLSAAQSAAGSAAAFAGGAVTGAASKYRTAHEKSKDKEKERKKMLDNTEKVA